LTESGDPTAAGISWSSTRLNLARSLSLVTPPEATVIFEKEIYSCSSKISILLSDGNWYDPNEPTVTIKSTGGDTEKLELVQAEANFNFFCGQIFTGLAPGDPNDGILQVSDGETVTVEYFDPNDGTGQAILAEDSAVIDGAAPALLSLQLMPIGQSPWISFETDEPTQALVRAGKTCPEPNELVRYRMTENVSHKVDLTGVDPNSHYFFVIEVADGAGNVTRADNGGLCFGFMTNGPGTFRVPGDYTTIQEAIISNWDGGEVLVADGVYTGGGNRDIDFRGREITVRSEGGPTECIIDCAGSEADSHRGFIFSRGEGSGAVLEGFTIKNGYLLNRNGGGITIVRSGPTIKNCILLNNTSHFEDETGEFSAGYGGGIFTYYGNPQLINCSFIGNSANDFNPVIIEGMTGGLGGGLYNYYSAVTLENCEFRSNQAWSSNPEPHSTGGGMRNYYGECGLSNCSFWGNSAQEQGGGMGNYNCQVRALNSLFSGNTVEDTGGGMNNDGSGGFLELINCTIADNIAGQAGGGAANYVFANYFLATNCIFWGNSDGSGGVLSGQFTQNILGELSVNYCCVQDEDPNDGVVFGGENNIDDDPLFVDATGGDYHLQSQAGRWDPNMARWVFDPNTSKAVDAGDPDSDWSGELWPDGGRINMGVYGGKAEASMSLATVGNVADLNHDGKVNLADWVLFNGHWLRAEVLQAADLDRDGVVDLRDFWLFQGEWLWKNF